MARPHLLPLVAFAVAALVAAVWWRDGGAGSTAAGSASSAPGLAPASPGAPADATAPVDAPARARGRATLPPPRAALGALARDVAAAADDEHQALAAAAAARWKQAEQASSADAWDLAADAQARAVAACGVGPRCVEEAYAEVLARSNARRLAPVEVPPGDEPVPLPERVEALIDTIDRYLELAPDSADADGLRFIAASNLWRHRHFDDETVRRLEAVVFAPTVSDVTAYATNQLVDLYLRSDRPDELRRLVDRLLASPGRLAGFPDLLERLHEVRARR